MPGYCSECGYQLNAESKFCPHCGAKINVEPNDRSSIKEEINKDLTRIHKRKEKTSNYKYALGIVGAILLHMLFAQENLIFYTSTSGSIFKGIWYSLAYSAAGIAFSIIVFTPVIYLSTNKTQRRLLKVVMYALLIGALLRITSWFIPDSSSITGNSTFEQNNQTSENLKLDNEKFSFYQSQKDNFIVFFPTEPSVSTAENALVIANSYQSQEIIGDGFIQYSVTVTKKKDNQPFITFETSSKEFLRNTLNSYMNNLGNNPQILYSEYFKFLDKYEAIRFKVNFVYQGIRLFNEGIFFVNKSTVFRLTISYTQTLETQIENKYLNFVNSFSLISY